MNLITNSQYYDTWYKHVRLKDSTKKNYTYALERFGDFLIWKGFSLRNGETLNFDRFYYSTKEDDYEPIDLQIFLDFVDYLKENKSIHVVESSITALKNYFGFLEFMELIEENPLARFSGSFYERPLKNRALSEKQSKTLLEASYQADPFFKQWFVLILLLLTCGLRATELCKLRKSQIMFPLNTIVIDKGQKTFASSVHMTEALSEYLAEYLRHPAYTNWLGSEEDKEVFFYKDKPLTPHKLNKIIKSLVSQTSINRNVTCHDLRATMAYLLYTNGVNTRAIQSQLRHKKLATTLLYLPIGDKLIN